MKKTLALVSIIFLFATSLSFPAYAAVKAGSGCAKAGSTSTLSDMKYTCIKSGGKLIWDAGVKIATSGLSSPTSTYPTNFANLFQNRKGIAYGAWLKVSKIVSSPVRDIPNVEVYKGPNTQVYVTDPSQIFKYATRLFPSVELPRRIVVLYWSNQDKDWATTKATELMGNKEMQNVIKEIGGPFVDCYNPINCNVGHAYIAEDGTAYIGLGNPSNAQGDENFTLGQKEIIEFYHALQLLPYHQNNSPITSKANLTSPNFPPAWLNIAGENIVFDFMKFEKNFNRFSSAQNSSDCMQQLGHSINIDWLNSYLDINKLNLDWSNNGFKTVADNACIGASLVEIFVSLKGPGILLDLHDQMSRGESFNDVFKGNFGLTWKEASPTISRVIWDKYQNKY